MKFLEIPTDNLYKFVAISGIVILLFSFVPFYHSYKLSIERITLSGEEEILGIEMEQVGGNVDKLEKEQDKLQKEINEFIAGDRKQQTKMGDSEPNDLPKISKEVESEKKLYEEKLREMESKILKIKEMIFQVDVRNKEIKNKDEVHRYILRIIKIENFISIISLVLGFVMAVWGFKNWYTKLQAHQDELIKNKVSPQ